VIILETKNNDNNQEKLSWQESLSIGIYCSLLTFIGTCIAVFGNVDSQAKLGTCLVLAFVAPLILSTINAINKKSTDFTNGLAAAAFLSSVWIAVNDTIINNIVL
jgi:hypothetical protein